MRSRLCFSCLFILTLNLNSCTKEKVPILENQPIVAPCSLSDAEYDIDSIYYGSSSLHSEAKYRVRFFDTLNSGAAGGELEFIFNKIPTSGIYKFVFQIDTNNLDLPNQIAYVADSGSFLTRSADAEFSHIYVEKNADELIISWCSVPDTTFYYDPVSFSYVGNHPYKYKIRKQF